jgi:hypothetical protein
MPTACCTRREASIHPRPTGRYQRRHPEHTAAYQAVQQQMESWLARHCEDDPHGKGVPLHVERDLRNFLHCGILAHGFARARCEACGHDFLIAFSCKGRGICPSCNTKRMVQTAAHLVDNVLPEVPLRQVVVSFPKWLRYYLAHDAGLFNCVIRIVQSEIERALIAHSPDAPAGARGGGIAFIHRFGSSLNAHPHLHLIVVDGVIARTGERLRFHQVHLTVDDIEVLREAIRLRVLRLFKRRGLLEPEVIDNLKAWGHGGGFSIHADVRVHAHDKHGRERLLRYCARPIFASERLTWIREGERLRYRLSKPDPKGQTELILTPDEFLDCIAALIPPPRKHRHRYFGILAPNSPWRKIVTARAGLPIETSVSEHQVDSTTPENDSQADNTVTHFGVSLWAMLISRIYEIFPLTCTQCGAQMRIIAFIEDPEPIRCILSYIGEPTEPPRIHPPRAPPDWPEPDQTITLDEDVNQDRYDYEFDQTVNW